MGPKREEQSRSGGTDQEQPQSRSSGKSQVHSWDVRSYKPESTVHPPQLKRGLKQMASTRGQLPRQRVEGVWVGAPRKPPQSN